MVIKTELIQDNNCPPYRISISWSKKRIMISNFAIHFYIVLCCVILLYFCNPASLQSSVYSAYYIQPNWLVNFIYILCTRVVAGIICWMMIWHDYLFIPSFMYACVRTVMCIHAIISWLFQNYFSINTSQSYTWNTMNCWKYTIIVIPEF